MTWLDRTRGARALTAAALAVAVTAAVTLVAPSADASPLGTIVIIKTDASLNAAEITYGPDGNFWIANAGTHKISRLTPQGGLTTFTDANLIEDPEDIVTGPDGNLWFTSFQGSAIGRITPTGTVTRFTDPKIFEPIGITAGPGGSLYFTNSGTDTIGRITTAGVVTTYSGTGISHPMRITTASDGTLWFTNTGNNTIGSLNTVGPVVHSYTASTVQSPHGIVEGADGALWFANTDNDSIGRITKAGVITNYPGTGIDTPSAVTAGPDGNIWFTNQGNQSIGRVSLVTHEVSHFTSAAVTDGPWGITGESGEIWFTTADSIGEVNGGGVPFPPPSITATPGNGQIKVTWPDAEPNGHAITGYTAYSSPDHHTCSTNGAGNSCTITGLTNGTQYQVWIKATNADGPSVAGPVVAVTPLRFWDVPASSPFFADIEWLAAQGIAGGYADGSFKPTVAVSRQVMAKWLYREQGSPDGPNPTCSTAPFPDVPKTSAFCGEIKWMVAHGITTGYADGKFHPADPVSRGATAAFLYRASGNPNGVHPACTPTGFTDVPLGAPFCGEIAWLVDHDITHGYADGGFHPVDAVSRQAMAAFLHRWY